MASPRSRASFAAALLLGVVSLVHLLSHPLQLKTVEAVTQVSLMPLLALWLWSATAAPRPRAVKLGLGALGFSWLGDAAPRLTEGTPAFLAMMGFFFVAQLIFAAAFWPYRQQSLLRRPALLLPYLLYGVGLISLCAQKAGPLLPAIIVYAAAIVVMAVLASGLGPLGLIGGAIFVLSDSLIAVRTFAELALPGHSAWVMATYIAAEVLLTVALLRAPPRPQPTPLAVAA